MTVPGRQAVPPPATRLWPQQQPAHADCGGRRQDFTACLSRFSLREGGNGGYYAPQKLFAPAPYQASDQRVTAVRHGTHRRQDISKIFFAPSHKEPSLRLKCRALHSASSTNEIATFCSHKLRRTGNRFSTALISMRSSKQSRHRQLLATPFFLSLIGRWAGNSALSHAPLPWRSAQAPRPPHPQLAPLSGPASSSPQPPRPPPLAVAP